MTNEEFEAACDNYELDDAYAEFIMEHCHGDRVICNGDALIRAMESGYLFEDFRDSLVVSN